MWVRLTEGQIQNKINFIEHYKGAKNAAEGSKLDANANVNLKNIAIEGRNFSLFCLNM